MTPSASRKVLRSASGGTIAVRKTAAAASAIALTYAARDAPTTASVMMPRNGRGDVRAGMRCANYDKAARRRKHLYTSPPMPLLLIPVLFVLAVIVLIPVSIVRRYQVGTSRQRA